MKVLVLGANGRTGALVVAHAIANDHEVSVLVRRVGRSYGPGVCVIEGDALNQKDVLRAMERQDAVVECIGGMAPWQHQTLERDVMRNIVAAMKQSGTRRLLVVSALGVAESRKQCLWWYRWLVVPTFLRGITRDKKDMEAIVRQSGLDWVIARAPILTDKAETGRIKVLKKSEKGRAITRVDLAAWLVEQLEIRIYIGQAVAMVNY
ncbi:NAD(P)-dependent oxidoreductase [Granulicella arctica]|uniref:NAD(P)-dependent oxidoreductase n=1 Tax=Granulicella arctica TaxID=940613 RepID=UPI0021E0D74B|nr:NAD(P)H-binding protein [Granulicella arctica]